jgi:hypothetical protein
MIVNYNQLAASRLVLEGEVCYCREQLGRLRDLRDGVTDGDVLTFAIQVGFYPLCNFLTFTPEDAGFINTILEGFSSLYSVRLIRAESSLAELISKMDGFINTGQ